MLQDKLAMALNADLWWQSVSGQTLDSWQKEFLTCSKDMLCLAARQSGKSWMSAVKSVHRALYYPNSLVLILSPSLRQSGELGRKCQDVCSWARLKTESESALQIQFSNRSRIINLPGTEATVRGYSAANLLIVDESARVPDELVYSVRPMLAVSNGQLIAITTPWIRAGWFYEAYSGESQQWHRMKVTVDQNPRISAEFLEAERLAMPEAMFNAEYYCKWLDSNSSLFNESDILKCESESIAMW